MNRKGASELAKELGRRPGNQGGQRVVVAGKGGVGKTTLSAALCLLAAADGRRVLAVDQDAQQNLAFSLGYPPEKAALLRPITQELDYMEQRVGARPGQGWGGLINLNPDVSDVTERFGVHISPDLHLLVMGGVVQASTGCLCPENSLLGALVRFLNSREDDLIDHPQAHGRDRALRRPAVAAEEQGARHDGAALPFAGSESGRGTRQVRGRA